MVGVPALDGVSRFTSKRLAADSGTSRSRWVIWCQALASVAERPAVWGMKVIAADRPSSANTLLELSVLNGAPVTVVVWRTSTSATLAVAGARHWTTVRVGVIAGVALKTGENSATRSLSSHRLPA